MCASNPHIFNRSVQLLQENCDFDFIDLNLGCPLDAVYQSVGFKQHFFDIKSNIFLKFLGMWFWIIAKNAQFRIDFVLCN